MTSSLLLESKVHHAILIGGRQGLEDDAIRSLLICLSLLLNREQPEVGSTICSFCITWAGTLYPPEAFNQCLGDESASKVGVLLDLSPGF